MMMMMMMPQGLNDQVLVHALVFPLEGTFESNTVRQWQWYGPRGSGERPTE